MAAVPTNRRAIVLAFFVAFANVVPFTGGFLFGYDIGVISGLLVMPDFVQRFGQENPDGSFTLSSSRQSIITSLLSAGTFVGALGQAFTADRFGRRPTILIWAAIFTIGVAIQTATIDSIAQITIGRFIAGLGVGAMSAVVPLYNGETAPKALRGTLLVLYQVQIITGIFLSYVFDLGTHALGGAASWRIPVGLQLVWGAILLSGIFFLPESPRHLLGIGKREEACVVISQLNGVPLDDPLVDELVDELQYAISAENEGGKATWLECFSPVNGLWRRVVNGMMLQFLQQLNGQNFYYYYGDTFFQSAGTQLSPYVIQVILGAVSVVGTVPALWAIERVGRRRLLLIGAAWQAVCALIAGLSGHFTLAPANTPLNDLTPRNKQGGDVLIAFAVLHVFGFSMFWGPTPWVYLGESFPLRIRPKAIALGSATNWVWNFLLSFFAPKIAADIGPLILLIFCGMLVVAFIYVFFFIPETKGLTLEEVDEMYRSGVKPWNSTSWTPTLGQRAHEKAIAHEIRNEKEKDDS
ncbi:general substrate transporter [Lentinula edodes]|uniref:General substrate transporter n=1 Tax=Lentinula lateritia TaxID=40482 RepID=A0A9W9A236_9AGAR|nr:general substrate transporter [Lentinula edodes]KAJ4471820.1 general substrate transporter [Lentinula edodes]